MRLADGHPRRRVCRQLPGQPIERRERRAADTRGRRLRQAGRLWIDVRDRQVPLADRHQQRRHHRSRPTATMPRSSRPATRSTACRSPATSTATPANGDEIGLFDGTKWYFDTNHNFMIDGGDLMRTNLRGTPLVGDFDGDGFDRPGHLARTTSSTSTSARSPAEPARSRTGTAPSTPRSTGAARRARNCPWPPTWTTTASRTSACSCHRAPARCRSSSGNWQFLISNDFADELPRRQPGHGARTIRSRRRPWATTCSRSLATLCAADRGQF